MTKHNSRIARHRYTILAVLLIIFALAFNLTLYLYPYRRFPPVEEEAGFSDPEKVTDMIKAKGYGWTPEKNPLTEMSNEDRKKRLGLLPAGDNIPEETATDPDNAEKVNAFLTTRLSQSELKHKLETAEVPQTLDYRGICTPVKDQGECGSCWAYASVGAFEANLIRSQPSLADTLDLSEQYLLSCDGSCKGSFIVKALSYLRTSGTVPEQCCPYTGEDSRQFCKTSCSEPEDVFRISSVRLGFCI